MRRTIAGLILLVQIICASAAFAQTWEGRDFSRIDDYVISLPAAAARSISSLASALVQQAGDDADKARAIYTWIVKNIEYDYESLAEGVRHDTAEEVLVRRRGVCLGHANLFTALAGEAGLDAATIIGQVKRAHPETPDEGHAWSAVAIHGEWLLLDTAMPRFLTRPESFIKTYFPDDPRWQLLATPITRQEFDRQLAAAQGFYDCGMSLIDPPAVEFNAVEQAHIILGVPRDVVVHAQMGKKGDERLPGRTAGWDMNWTGEKTASLLFVQRKGETVEIHARFPERGLWYIGVQAGWKGQTARGAISFNITVDRGMTAAPPFPEARGNLSEIDFLVVRPRERVLEAGTVVRFVVESSEAVSVAVVMKKGHPLVREGTVFYGDILISAGPVYLAVDYGGKGVYLFPLEYEAK